MVFLSSAEGRHETEPPKQDEQEAQWSKFDIPELGVDIVSEASEVGSLLSRLEERYDKEQSDQSGPAPLSPNIEQFLRDLDQGFESSEPTGESESPELPQ